MSEIPWHEDDIFHDKLDAYPLYDYFPLKQKAKVNETEHMTEDAQKEETGWH